ncbi:MAG: erythromycin esterase family protein [Candidatus Aminicenantes bacterium]|nr:MAG: erythromycin esterase family protein [Candidatus Aminicenantes bacterium]
MKALIHRDREKIAGTVRPVFAFIIFMIGLVGISCSPFISSTQDQQNEKNVLEIGDWLRQKVVSFSTCEPGTDYLDLMPLKEMIGNASIVALGEATHGTSEFFKMKHRILEFLVKEMGFNTFAMEAGFAESLRVNRYIQGGQGDPAVVLKGLGYWTWKTQEVLDMIIWMQNHNQNPNGYPTVSFWGFDMQYFALAMDEVINYLNEVDVPAAELVESLYSPLRKYETDMMAYKFAYHEHEKCREDVEKVYQLLQENQDLYENITGKKKFDLALQNSRIVIQWEDDFSDRHFPSLSIRDAYMAENASWIKQYAGPGAKVVLWSHNGHLGDGFSPNIRKTMGTNLREKYNRSEMVIIAFNFYRGWFNAYALQEGGMKLRAIYTPYPKEESYSTYFVHAGIPAFFLDLRDLLAGDLNPAASDWIQGPRPFRTVGSTYDIEKPEDYYSTIRLPNVFDIVIYFHDTSASQLLLLDP